MQGPGVRILLSLSASMYTSHKRYGLAVAARGHAQREDSLFEENLINLGQDQIWSEHPLQIELLKLLQALIVLEHHLGPVHEEAEHQADLSREWRQTLSFQEAISSLQYVQPHRLTSQGLLVSAVVRGLQPAYGYGMHPAWVSLVTHSLPYKISTKGGRSTHSSHHACFVFISNPFPHFWGKVSGSEIS